MCLAFQYLCGESRAWITTLLKPLCQLLHVRDRLKRRLAATPKKMRLNPWRVIATPLARRRPLSQTRQPSRREDPRPSQCVTVALFTPLCNSIRPHQASVNAPPGANRSRTDSGATQAPSITARPCVAVRLTTARRLLRPSGLCQKPESRPSRAACSSQLTLGRRRPFFRRLERFRDARTPDGPTEIRRVGLPGREGDSLSDRSPQGFGGALVVGGTAVSRFPIGSQGQRLMVRCRGVAMRAEPP
jgi:hypothetical protein